MRRGGGSLAAGVPVTGLVLREGVRSHAVGRGLHHAEQEYVARLVRGALREAGVETTTDETRTGSADGVNAHGLPSIHTTFFSKPASLSSSRSSTRCIVHLQIIIHTKHVITLLQLGLQSSRYVCV